MPYGNVKVYFDGSHYIGIPHTERPQRPRIKKREKEILLNEKSEVIPEYKEIASVEVLPSGRVLEEIEIVGGEIKPVLKQIKQKGTKTTTKKLFEKLYSDTHGLKRKERREIIIKGLQGCFEKHEDLIKFVDLHLERKQRNNLYKRIRLTRKANMHEFNYFCTFTYDNNKHTEESFKKKLRSCFKMMCHRKGWKYIGVWERSPEKKRLHFHGIFYIPENGMIGELKEVKDYNLNTHQMQTTIQNTYFNARFGRSDFEKINDRKRIGEALAYLMKYIEKTGEKIVYSRGLYQYFITDVMDEDVVCKFGVDDRKLILFDNFKCFDEGTFVGEVKKEVIEQMRKAN